MRLVQISRWPLGFELCVKPQFAATNAATPAVFQSAAGLSAYAIGGTPSAIHDAERTDDGGSLHIGKAHRTFEQREQLAFTVLHKRGIEPYPNQQVQLFSIVEAETGQMLRVCFQIGAIYKAAGRKRFEDLKTRFGAALLYYL